MSSACNQALALTGIAGDPGSHVHALDPRAKTVAFVGISVIAVSTPPSQWPVYLLCGIALGAVIAIARIPIRELWRRTRWVLPPVLAVAVLIPIARVGGESWALGPLTIHAAGLQVFAGVASKAAIGSVAAALLAMTTGLPQLLQGLERMRVPPLLVMTAGFMYRYLFVIADEVKRMRAGLTARGYRPRNALQAAALGRLTSAMFLRTHARGERVHLAMRARGYQGRMPQTGELELRNTDLLFAGGLLAVLLLARVVVGLGA